MKWTHIRNEICILKKYLHSHVHCNLFTVTKIWKQPKCVSVGDWIKKIWYTHTHTHTHTGVLFCLEKKEIVSFVTTGMNYAKWNKPDTERQILYGITIYGNLKKKKADLIEIRNRMVIARGWGEWEMGGCRSKGSNFQL